MKPTRTRPPGIGPRSAAAAPSAAMAGVPASTLRKLRRPCSICSGVRFIRPPPRARRRRLRAHPQPIEPRDASRTEGEQHPDRARLDQVLVDQEIRPLRPEFRASRWNRREIEHRKQREPASASELCEQSEDEADPDCRQRQGDTEIERADPRRVSQPVEERRERPRRRFQIRGRRPVRERHAVLTPGRIEEFRVALVQEVPADERAQDNERDLLSARQRHGGHPRALLVVGQCPVSRTPGGRQRRRGVGSRHPA